MAIVSRCNPRENVGSVMLPHDRVTTTITSIIEVEENVPISTPSFGDLLAREVQISSVQCSNSRVTVEEVKLLMNWLKCVFHWHLWSIL